jgi:hypothetical protein
MLPVMFAVPAMLAPVLVRINLAVALPATNADILPLLVNVILLLPLAIKYTC